MHWFANILYNYCIIKLKNYVTRKFYSVTPLNKCHQNEYNLNVIATPIRDRLQIIVYFVICGVEICKWIDIGSFDYRFCNWYNTRA